MQICVLQGVIVMEAYQNQNQNQNQYSFIVPQMGKLKKIM